MRRLGTLPLMHQPGERWMYNTGADVLGVLIARASGQPLETFLRERIFEPLGMTDTGFSVPRGRRSTGSRRSYVDRSRRPARSSVYDERRRAVEPAARVPVRARGGLVSTVDDFLAFGQMMLDSGEHGGERILSRPVGRDDDDAIS